jgi:hypothetical protein
MIVIKDGLNEMEVSPRQAQLLVLAGLVSEHEDGTHRFRPHTTWEAVDAALDEIRGDARLKLLGGNGD